MILVVTVEKNRKNSSDIGSRLINAEFWHKAKTVETTKTQFFYPMNYRDRRENPTLLTTTEDIGTIETAANLAPTTEAIQLPVHIDNKVGNATEVLYFRTKDIVFGYAFPGDATKSMVFILSGAFKVNRYLVDNTLAEIVALVTL